MKTKFRDLMARFCKEVAQLSHCVRAKQACVLTSLNGERVLAFGYNGTFRGGPNTCTGPNEPGKCECIHAEVNALVKTRPNEDFAAFITQSPCMNCAKLLINSGCKEVYYMEAYRDAGPVFLLKSNGVMVDRI